MYFSIRRCHATLVCILWSCKRSGEKLTERNGFPRQRGAKDSKISSYRRVRAYRHIVVTRYGLGWNGPRSCDGVTKLVPWMWSCPLLEGSFFAWGLKSQQLKSFPSDICIRKTWQNDFKSKQMSFQQAALRVIGLGCHYPDWNFVQASRLNPTFQVCRSRK